MNETHKYFILAIVCGFLYWPLWWSYLWLGWRDPRFHVIIKFIFYSNLMGFINGSITLWHIAKGKDPNSIEVIRAMAWMNILVIGILTLMETPLILDSLMGKKYI